ncbi:MAG: hypothetical protein K8U57_21075 [Planctomycetes bacterium]|nr:hypothetical protein [Planctomycetota bacterium]
MSQRTRREMFGDLGKGMIAAAVGSSLAGDLGFVFAAEDPGHITFGELEPLVSFLQETPPDKLLPKVTEKLKSGTDLKTFVAAAALANARAFGGEDYIGFHTLMALTPAFKMANEETRPERRALPVMKVLVRNSTRLQALGGKKAEVLKPVQPGKLAADKPAGEQLRDNVRKVDLAAAEGTFAAICAHSKPEDALNALMVEVDDGDEVHRTVLVSRAWDLINFVGTERAHTLLRQSVHYCVKAEQPNQIKYNQPVRDMLPKLLDEYKLIGMKPGTKSADDAWVEKFANTIFAASPTDAGNAVAAALAEGISAEAIGEALSLAANQLVLRDEGRPKNWVSEGKPIGSIHGDSVGVHACDTVHAWRNLSRAGDRRTQVTSLILAGYQVARDRDARGDFKTWEAYPRADARDAVKGIAADSLIKELDGAIREKNQARAAALTARIGADNHDAAKDVFSLFRGYAISEDGALHAEKYYATTSDEFAAARAAFKWRQLIALARVTASAYGYPAPGYKEACELTKS